MEVYEIGEFSERIQNIERFIIEFAAADGNLLTHDFRGAARLPSYEDAMSAIQSFPEDFVSLQRILAVLDKTLASNLMLESGLRDQLSLLQLRLRIASLKKPMTFGRALLNRMISPVRRRFRVSRTLYDAESILIDLGKVRAISKLAQELCGWRQYIDDDVFKPSNVNSDRVIELIDTAISQIEQASAVPPTQRDRMLGYLQEAKREVVSIRPSWSKIVGALVIVAAITSGLADAPDAAKTLREVIEYIMGKSVEQPLQRYLSPPPNEHPNGDTQFA
ncbi:MAG: hypothetical protein MN733_44300 [Nitrososphaera sp.]|nr:hypothetical protein [Nitrososphaera sp.]